MLRHFLITGLRNFWRNKSSTILNILGLAIGMATTLLILEYVFNELSFDRFHKNKENIYRVIVRAGKRRSYKSYILPDSSCCPIDG